MNEWKIKERALLLHKKIVGKIGIVSKVEVNNEDDLSLAYTPGVAEPCKIIEEVKLAAAYAISSLVSDKEIHPNYIIPNALDSRVGHRVAAGVPKQQSNQG